MLISIILLGAVSFILVAGYLLVRSRQYTFPLWLYVVVALLCWWAVAAYPLIFYVERRIAADRPGYCGELYKRKIGLSWLVLLSSCCVQGLLSLLFASELQLGVYDDVPVVCALFVGLVLTIVLLTAIEFMEKKLQ